MMPVPVMTSSNVPLRTGAFFAEQPVTHTFPDTWRVIECRMAGQGDLVHELG